MKTKFKIILSIVLFCLCSFTYSDWPVLYTGEFSGSNNGADAITTDNYGNCYVTGFSQTTDQGQYFYHTITTIKYNSSGGQVWKTVYDYHYGQAEPTSIFYDPVNDRVIATGRFVNLNDNSYDIMTIAYTSTGGVNWVEPYDVSTGRDACGFCVKCDSYGYIYVTGKTHGVSYFGEDPHEYYLTTLKYSTNGGSPLWAARYYYDYNDIGYSLDIDPDNGDVYVTGMSSNGSDNDFIVIKYNTSGEEQWVNRYDNGGNDSGLSIAFFPSHAVYATGTSYVSGEQRMTTIKYNKNTGERVWLADNLSGVGNSISLYQRWFGNGWNTFTVDVFVTGYGGTFPSNSYGQTIRYSNYGGQDWLATYYGTNSTLFNSLKIDGNENVFVAGYDNFNYEENNWYAVKYDASGTELWDDAITTYSRQMAFGLALDDGGNAFVTGFASPVSGDLLLSINNSYESYYYTMKYPNDYGDNLPNSSNVMSNVPKEFSLNQNFPNPFNPITKIQYVIPQNGYVSLKVYDILGREIQTLVNEYKNAGYYNVTFDGSNLSSGVYIYKLNAGAYSDIKKMILIK